MSYLFQNATAFDPYTGQGVPNASGQVFAMADTAFATPLTVILLSSGLQTTELVSDQYSQLPGFDAGDNVQVRFRSGEFTKVLNTSTPLVGPQGLAGKSAYQVAIEGGYTGTEAEYNATLTDAPSLVARAETAEQAAIDAADLVGAPAGAAVLAAISVGGAARGELSNAIEDSTAPLAQTDNRSFTCQRIPASGGIPEHVVTLISNGLSSRSTAQHAAATGAPKLVYPVGELETLRTFHARTGANVVINGSGWWVSTGRRVGLTIHDGVMIQDWEPEPQTDWGVQALVFYRDGSARVEDRSTPGATLLANGAWNTVCFGKAAIRAGADQGLATNPKYSGVTGRQSIGVTNDGKILILTFPGQTGAWGATMQNVLDAAAPLDVRDLYMNDGGGSTQLLVNGEYVIPSTDVGGQRTVPDALCITASAAGPIPYPAKGTAWLPLDTTASDATYTPTLIAGDDNDCRVRVLPDGTEEAVIRVGLTGIPTGKRAFVVPAAARPKKFKTGVLGSNAGALVLINIGTDGNGTAFSVGMDATKVMRGEIRYTR